MNNLDILQNLLNDKYIKDFYGASLKGSIGKFNKKINSDMYKNVSKILFPDNILERLLAKEERDEMAYIQIAKEKILSKAHHKQREVITSTANRIFILSDRQSGKSESFAMDIVINACTKNTPMIYIAGSMSAGFDIIWRRIIDYSKFVSLPIMKANKGSGIITWENGSEIKLGSSADKDTIENLRGITRKCIYVDEVQKVKEPLRLLNQVLMPMTNIYGNDYKFMITGTPPKARGTWFQKTWENDHEWTKIEFQLEDNPLIKDPVSLRAEKKKVLLLDEYEREYEHKFSYSDEVVVFPIISTYEPEKLMNEIERIRPTHIVIGVDVGFGDNSAVVSILYSKNGAIALEGVKGHWTTDILASEIKKIENKSIELCKPFEYHKNSRLDIRGRVIEEEINNTTKVDIIVDCANLLTIQDLRKVYRIKAVGCNKTKNLESLNSMKVMLMKGVFKIPANGMLYEEFSSAAFKEKDDGSITDELVTTLSNSHLDPVKAAQYAWDKVNYFIGKDLKDLITE